MQIQPDFNDYKLFFYCWQINYQTAEILLNEKGKQI